MPVCYIYRQQEGRQAELPKGRRDFKMATLDVTEKVNVLVDAIGWEGFCEELMEYDYQMEKRRHRNKR